jgi:peptidoglycan/xylan/chitin deacetylase (PgdA/CDA1 family)
MIDLVNLVGTHVPRWGARFFPDMLFRMPTTERVAYLTFDDGPTDRGTSALLDVLERFETKASFFLLGREVRRRPALVRAMAEAGHTIGNHSYSHPNAWAPGTSDTVVLRELERATGVIQDLTQRPVQWMRLPYGRFTDAMRHWCQVRRQRCTMWDVGPGDFLPTARREAVEQRVLDLIRPGSIIVLHDNPRTQDMVPQVLSTLLERLSGDGWRFAAL